jgi:hypothetical protein
MMATSNFYIDTISTTAWTGTPAEKFSAPLSFSEEDIKILRRIIDGVKAASKDEMATAVEDAVKALKSMVAGW